MKRILVPIAIIILIAILFVWGIKEEPEEEFDIDIDVDIVPYNPKVTGSQMHPITITITNNGENKIHSLDIRFETSHPNFRMMNCGQITKTDNLIIYRDTFKEGESWDPYGDSEYKTFYFQVIKFEEYYTGADFELNIQILYEDEVIFSKDIKITVKPQEE